MTKEEKEIIVGEVVSILKSPNKNEKIASLRDKVLNKESTSENTDVDNEDVIYSVIQAIEELYA